MSYFEYRHRVGLDETNVVGNVYYTHYLRWQGRCREMFLHEYTPELVAELGKTIVLVTTRVSCNYYRELAAFDEILLRMSGSALTASRLTMSFQYFRLAPEGHDELVAESEQEVACMLRTTRSLEPAPLPSILREVVESFMKNEPVRVGHQGRAVSNPLPF